MLQYSYLTFFLNHCTDYNEEKKLLNGQSCTFIVKNESYSHDCVQYCLTELFGVFRYFLYKGCVYLPKLREFGRELCRSLIEALLFFNLYILMFLFYRIDFFTSVITVYILYIYISLLEYNCFTVLLVSAVQQSESAICMHISPHMPSLLRLPPTLPFPPL